MGQAFDDITNALGLKKPIPVVGMAGGGVVPGSGTGDVVPALLEPGETVVDKDTSRKWAWLFKAMGVPGYSSGGLIPNPVKKILGDIGGDSYQRRVERPEAADPGTGGHRVHRGPDIQDNRGAGQVRRRWR